MFTYKADSKSVSEDATTKAIKPNNAQDRWVMNVPNAAVESTVNLYCPSAVTQEASQKPMIEVDCVLGKCYNNPLQVRLNYPHPPPTAPMLPFIVFSQKTKVTNAGRACFAPTAGHKDLKGLFYEYQCGKEGDCVP